MITNINPLNAELNPICHPLALLGAHHILHVSRIRVKDQFLEKMPSSLTLVLMRFLSKQQAVKLYLALHKS